MKCTDSGIGRRMDYCYLRYCRLGWEAIAEVASLATHSTLIYGRQIINAEVVTT